METPQIQNQIDELQSQIFSENKKILDGNQIYIGISIVVFLFLIFIPPNFLFYQKKNKKGELERKISFKKLFISWIIISIVLNIGIFAYNYSQKKF